MRRKMGITAANPDAQGWRIAERNITIENGV
jgi:hypothetical protein